MMIYDTKSEKKSKEIIVVQLFVDLIFSVCYNLFG